MTSKPGLKDQIERVVPLYSTSALRMLHDSIRNGLLYEDTLSEHEDRPYGYREHEDFKWQADAIEKELENREQAFERIIWQTI
jgi:hypothetical protein